MAAATAPADPCPSPAPRRGRGRPPKNPAPSSPVSPPLAAEAEAASGYERVREARIRENMARMQKLGILDLAQTLSHSDAAAASRGRGRPQRKPVEPGSDAGAVRVKPAAPSPVRTSLRLRNVGVGRLASRGRRKPVEPGSDAGAVRVKPAAPSPARRSLRLKSIEPVSYSELRRKMESTKGVKSEFIEAGSKEEVYTEENEKILGTCQTAWTLFVDGYDKDDKRIYDQVRGKTCHQCRYGENMLEAKKNPNWICPVCRGICNCSICRTKRGWFPTGTAYRKVVSLGHKSVAHYLIATKRSSASSEESNPADSSNKLLFAKSETSCLSDHEASIGKESQEDGETSSKVKTKEAPCCRQLKNSDGHKDVSRSETVVTSDSQDDRVNKDAWCATPSKPAAPRKRKHVERSPDCVASRLRSRSNKP